MDNTRNTGNVPREGRVNGGLVAVPPTTFEVEADYVGETEEL